MKKKDKILAFAVLLSTIINTYEFTKFIKNTLFVPKEPNKIETVSCVPLVNDNLSQEEIIENETTVKDNAVIEKPEIPSESEIESSISSKNQTEIISEILTKKYHDKYLYGYLKNNADYYDINGSYLGSIDIYQKIVIDFENNSYYRGMLEDGTYGYFDKESIDLMPATFVEVDISSQTLNFYQDSNLILTTAVTTGKDGVYDTRIGYFQIAYKDYNTFLEGPDYKVHVDYWMPFDGGIGLHDASWRGTFGGDIYTYNGSHGCVNMPYDAAQTVYENVSAGTRVLVHK